MNTKLETRVKTLLSALTSVEISDLSLTTSTDNLLQWDSLIHMKFILALEEEFGLVFTHTQIEQMTSIESVLFCLNQHD